MHKRAIYLYVIWSKLVCSYLLGFLFEFFNSPLVDSTALVDQMPGGRRLAGIDMTNHDNVDMNLLRTAHLDSSWHVRTLRKVVQRSSDGYLKNQQKKPLTGYRRIAT